MIAGVNAADRRNLAPSRHDKLIVVADVVDWFGTSDGELVKVQSENKAHKRFCFLFAV